MNHSNQKNWPALLVCLAVLASAGCGKKQPPAAVVETSPASAVAPVPRPAGPPVANAAPPSKVNLAASATADAATEQLTMELRRYVIYTRKIPKTFEEFAAAHPMKFPPAPAGKHYAIDNGKVVVQ